MKREFKVGDRVKVVNCPFFTKANGFNGSVVAIDSDGDLLIKMDVVIDSYRYCSFNDYYSDKRDLINMSENDTIELI